MPISIDSRTINSKDIFIPVKGKNFDGHDYTKEVTTKGAYVLDVSLGEFAAKQRLLYDIPIIAITGSSGKTTAKEYIAQLLSTKYKVLKSIENQNNEIGVPLTLLKLNANYQVKADDQLKEKHISESQVKIKKGSYQVVVLELAMRGLGEIEYLAQIVKPTHVVITNIGSAHIGRLGSKENIKKAKSEILLATKHSSFAYLNSDDYYFDQLEKTAKENNWQVIPFSEDISNLKTGLLAKLAKDFTINIKSIDNYFWKNIKNRMRVIRCKDFTIIDDTYNANPDSVAWAIDKLRKEKGRKIVVLGDMLELGNDEIKYHSDISLDHIDIAFFLGPIFKKAAKDNFKNTKFYTFLDKAKLIKKIQSIIKKGDIILIKGSRAMKMEEIVNSIC